MTVTKRLVKVWKMGHLNIMRIYVGWNYLSIGIPAPKKFAFRHKIKGSDLRSLGPQSPIKFLSSVVESVHKSIVIITCWWRQKKQTTHATLNMKSGQYQRELLVLNGEEGCGDIAKVDDWDTASRRHSNFKTYAYGKQQFGCRDFKLLPGEMDIPCECDWGTTPVSTLAA
ncbi:hypothetical protein BDP27DRAFT_1366165 [Rhodocollybia butyracea]|uniref:Uncharacterized protein n=1 Tax=Rhodocollybia butyracea TaxID=206335 RepID=A0A9P5U4M8_9AGAR|nr:hypothetical protein BDP27DRAFT_1366165 [Rhodocollybia butyracea]